MPASSYPHVVGPRVDPMPQPQIVPDKSCSPGLVWRLSLLRGRWLRESLFVAIDAPLKLMSAWDHQVPQA